MLVWRVTRKVHANEPLSGEGARRYGGRWNHIGESVVYASQSLSLAVLEYLVNLSVPDLPSDIVSVRIDIPDRLPRTELLLDKLPKNWRAFLANERLKDIGTDWLRKGATPILMVPSAVIPREHNFLINPKHILAQQIVEVSVEPFALDERLRAPMKRSPKRTRR
jgi:RES domain-containing protein